MPLNQFLILKWQERTIFSRKKQSFCHKLKFYNPYFFKPDSVDLISNLGFIIVQRIHSLKYQKSTTSG